MNYISKRKKYLVLIIFLIIIVWLLSISFFDRGIDKEKIIHSHNVQSNLVTNISINGIFGSYDKDNGIFYFSADSFIFKNVKIISPYKVKHFIKKIDDKHYSVFVYSSEYYYQYEICLVNIPLVNIYTFDIFESEKCDVDLYECPMGITINDYKNSSINGSHNILNSYGKIKVRGKTSRYFEKKSYKISVDKKANFLGLTSDNDWVLDSLYSDPSKIRNKLSSDIWNAINNNQKVNNDLGVAFVEVFINNEYRGLYTIKNNVDKHVTSLDDNGLLIKSINHFSYDYLYLLKNKDFSIDDDGLFLNMKVKKYNSYLFNIFLDKMYNYYKNNAVFDNFNDDNFVNYKILVALMSGDDNVTKNIYFSLDNSNDKILITPWDMDMTWGLIFDSNSSLFSSKMMENYNDEFRMKCDVTYNLDEDSMKRVKQRYWELRNDIINMQTINSYLDEYMSLLINSGSTQRDSDKWYDYDVEFEIEEIREWAKKRIDYLDSYFKLD